MLVKHLSNFPQYMRIGLIFDLDIWPIDLNFNLKGIIYSTREKGGDLTQSYDKTLHSQKNPKRNVTTQKHHPQLRLHNDCGPT